MRISLKRLMALAALAIVTSVTADEPEQAPVTVDDVVDPAFEQLCPARLIGDAWLGLDSGRMTDVALLLQHGERTLGRERKGVSADQVARLAVSAAVRNGDQESLRRLGTAAKRGENAELSALIESSQALGSASRTAVAGMVIPIDQIHPTEYRQLHVAHKALRRAMIIGDPEQIDALQEQLDLLDGVSPERRNKLRVLIDSSRSMMPPKPVVDDDVVESLSLLTQISRPEDYDIERIDENELATDPVEVIGSF